MSAAVGADRPLAGLAVPVVILAGPTGAGKSHLAAVWREKSNAPALSPETHDEAAAVAAAPPGRSSIEDVERSGFAETALFHLINAVRAARHQPAHDDPPLARRLAVRCPTSRRG